MEGCEVVLRILLATIMAGVKTHILVCLGAASFAMLELFLMEELMSRPDMASVFSLSIGGVWPSRLLTGLDF